MIGLAPYSFHYDESKTCHLRHRNFQYLVALNDLHNFSISAAECRKIFREGFLNIRLPLDSFNLNNVFEAKGQMRCMDWCAKVSARNTVEGWSKKNFPETLNENIKIFHEYLTLCEENHVRPIIFLPPMTQCYKKYFNREMLYELYQLVQEAQQKYPTAVFLDGWELENFSDEDFYDVEHLNRQGAAKFSAILNGVIEEIERIQ